MRIVVVLLLVLTLHGCGDGSNDASSSTTSEAHTPTTSPMTLATSAFADGGAIPVEYTCDGANETPDLQWSGEPPATKVIAITVIDPDANDFEHWIRVGDVDGVPWRGPCPPKGAPHHYVFTVHALDSTDVRADRDSIEAHTIASATITGTYQRAGS